MAQQQSQCTLFLALVNSKIILRAMLTVPKLLLLNLERWLDGHRPYTSRNTVLIQLEIRTTFSAVVYSLGGNHDIPRCLCIPTPMRRVHAHALVKHLLNLCSSCSHHFLVFLSSNSSGLIFFHLLGMWRWSKSKVRGTNGELKGKWERLKGVLRAFVLYGKCCG